MRILIVSEAIPYLPCRDGFRFVLGGLIRELSARHELHLIAMANGGDSAEEAAWPRQYCASFAAVRQLRGIFAKARALTGAADPVTAALVSKSLRAIEPTIIHIEGPSLAALLRGKPDSLCKVLCVHDSKSLRYREFARYARGARARVKFMMLSAAARRNERRWFRYADRVVVTSSADADALATEIAAAKLAVIPSGIDLEHFAFRSAPEPGRIVFTGNMSWPPNEDAAAYFANEVLPRIHARVLGASFWIAGADPSARVRSLDRIAGVHVTGTVPDLRPWLWSASVYASPMRFGAGVKIKLLQAMAAGAPIVATAKSLCATPLIDGREAIIADGADEMARAIAELLDNPERRRALSLAARKKAEAEYGWPQIAARFERLYAEIGADQAPQIQGKV